MIHFQEYMQVVIIPIIILCILIFLPPMTNAHTPPVPEEYMWEESWTLYPKDADLRCAGEVKIFSSKEENSHPYLYSWKNGSIVMFPVHIHQPGTYKISIEYSRYSVFKDTLAVGVFALPEPLAIHLMEDTAHFYADIPKTKNWENYRTMDIGLIPLHEGTIYLAFTNKDNSPYEYIMNLRKVHLEYIQ